MWLTADGVAVLDHDGIVGSRIRRRPIKGVDRADLSPSVPSLEELYGECGNQFVFSLDVKDPDAAPATLAAARAAGATDRLWLCHPELNQVAAWRALDADVHLVDSTRLRLIREGPERRAANLVTAGVDAINMHASDWSVGLATLFHRFGRLAFAWDAQQERVLRSVLAMGVDGVYSDHVDRMVAAIDEVHR